MSSTPHWVRDAIFYQIFPDRFARSGRVAQPSGIRPWGTPPTHHNFMGGDLLGIVERLDYLVELGVNAIFLNPIFASTANHRYHTYDYFTVDPILGGNEAFRRLLDAAHERGVRVIIDGVFNHASRGFFQFNHLLESGPESPYADWFHVFRWPVAAYNENEPARFAAWWGLHALPKFNTDTAAVREFLWSVVAHWVEFGIDGWRLDVPNEIDDDAFWHEFRRRCRAVNPDCYIVGELWHDAARWLQGDQFDGQMNYPFTRVALGFFLSDHMDQSETHKTGYGYMPSHSGESLLHEFDRLFNRMYAADITLSQMNVIGSHDVPRLMTLARGNTAAVKQLFLCQFTVPGAPNIYYGDEIGMFGRHDPDNRRCFPWDDDDAWNHDLRSTVQECIRLRHALPALRHGQFVPLYGNHDVALFMRVATEQSVLVGFNTSDQTRRITIPWDKRLGGALRSALDDTIVRRDQPALELPPRGSQVLVSDTRDPLVN